MNDSARTPSNPGTRKRRPGAAEPVVSADGSAVAATGAAVGTVATPAGAVLPAFDVFFSDDLEVPEKVKRAGGFGNRVARYPLESMTKGQHFLFPGEHVESVRRSIGSMQKKFSTIELDANGQPVMTSHKGKPTEKKIHNRKWIVSKLSEVKVKSLPWDRILKVYPDAKTAEDVGEVWACFATL